MKKKLRKGLMFFLALVLGFGFSMPELVVEASGLPFSVRSIIPENQFRPDRTFFDLLTTPGHEQTIVIVVQNITDEEIEVQATINTATTNRNGIADYGTRTETLDDSLLFLVEDIVTAPDIITIPPNEAYHLELEVVMPEESFDGVLAGGVTLSEVRMEEESTEDRPAGIRNIFHFTLAILLWQGDMDVEPHPVLHGIRAEREGGETNIFVHIQNSAAAFLNDMIITARVTDVDGDEVLMEYVSGSADRPMQMVPNSNFEFRIPVERRVLGVGEYSLSLEISGRDDDWAFAGDFEVLEAELDIDDNGPIFTDIPPLDSQSVTDDEVVETDSPFPWFIVWIVLAGMVVAGGVITLLIIYHLKKKNEAFDKMHKDLLLTLIESGGDE